jgi:transcriptional regulator of arginine metabolism
MAEPTRNETQERQLVLRQLIREGEASTQEDLCASLRKKDFDVTQSTVSRDLRRIGAIKVTNADGEIVYRLPEDHVTTTRILNNDLGGLLIEIQSNESMIVLHTTPGSASLVARSLDAVRSQIGILGTIAGDDAIFVVPATTKKIGSVIKKIKDELL